MFDDFVNYTHLNSRDSFLLGYFLLVPLIHYKLAIIFACKTSLPCVKRKFCDLNEDKEILK